VMATSAPSARPDDRDRTLQQRTPAAGNFEKIAVS
jgi:hypothetical protein